MNLIADELPYLIHVPVAGVQMAWERNNMKMGPNDMPQLTYIIVGKRLVLFFKSHPSIQVLTLVIDTT